jgi:GDPmannose 4,6-dehydratase
MTESEPKRAIITGITGQDGSYLAELLLSKGYEVHGFARPSTSLKENHIDSKRNFGAPEGSARVIIHYRDLRVEDNLRPLLEQIQPHEVYSLAAQSNVHLSFSQPVLTGDVTAMGTVRWLEAIRQTGIPCRFYQASSSEMYGATPPPQDEDTPFSPRSPYGVAKVYSHWITRNYREAYGMYAVNGILFNHESPRRPETFVTRKISSAVARIVEGQQSELLMGNIDASRDWGYAPQYVEGMWRMLQADRPTDYVLATNSSYTVRDFLEFSFSVVGLDWANFVRVDKKYLRPTDVMAVRGDFSRAERVLGWVPTVRAPELARIMVEADLQRMRSVARG